MRFKLLLALLLADLSPLPAQERPGPWLLHPLQPPSQLAIQALTLRLDYRERKQRGSCSLLCSAQIENPGPHACDEDFMMVCSDPASRLTLNGRSLSLERLVMPMPGGAPGELTRVAMFHLLLQAGEQARLEFTAQQGLEYLSHNRHRVRLVLPLERAWNRCPQAAIAVELTPELRLLAPPFGELGHSSGERASDILVEAEWRDQSWLGRAWANSALRRGWQWAVLASVLGVSLLALGRRGAWLALPSALVMYWALCRWDPVLEQWTYYREAERLRQVLSGQTLCVAVWTLVGTWVGLRFDPGGKKEAR